MLLLCLRCCWVRIVDDRWELLSKSSGCECFFEVETMLRWERFDLLISSSILGVGDFCLSEGLEEVRLNGDFDEDWTLLFLGSCFLSSTMSCLDGEAETLASDFNLS